MMNKKTSEIIRDIFQNNSCKLSKISFFLSSGKVFYKNSIENEDFDLYLQSDQYVAVGRVLFWTVWILSKLALEAMGLETVLAYSVDGFYSHLPVASCLQASTLRGPGKVRLSIRLSCNFVARLVISSA